MAQFEVGQEWYDGAGNYIIVAVEEVPTWDETSMVEYVTTYDFEGIIDRQPAAVWKEFIDEMDAEPVTEPSLPERIKAWVDAGAPNFPLQP